MTAVALSEFRPSRFVHRSKRWRASTDDVGPGASAPPPPARGEGADVGSTIQPGLAPAEWLAGTPTREFSKPTIRENRRTDDKPSDTGRGRGTDAPRRP